MKPNLKIIDGGGGDGGDMWEASVETRLTDLAKNLDETRKETRADFRWTWGLLVLLLIAGGGAFTILSNRLFEIVQKLP